MTNKNNKKMTIGIPYEQTKEGIRLVLGGTFVKNKLLGRQEIAKHLLNKYSFKTIKTTTEGEVYVYDEGIYVPNGDKVIKAEIESILQSRASSHEVKEILDKIKRQTYIEREEFEKVDKNLICLNNCVLDIKNNTTIKHSPKFLFLNKVPIDYNPDAKCPKTIQFFKEVLLEEDIDSVQEFLGYLLYRYYFIKKSFIALGATDSGKTTFYNRLVKFIGKKNTAGVSLQSLNSRFAPYFLYGKLFNMVDDLSTKDMYDISNFKIVTGHGYVTAEAKFGNMFQFENYSKLAYATNKIPLPKDENDDAFYNRFYIWRFNKIYDDNNKKTDKHLIDKLTTKEEQEGLLNYAIEGLRRLLKNKKFSNTQTIEEVKLIMQKSGSSVGAFAHDMLEKASDESWISKDEIFEAYTKYVAKHTLANMGKSYFGKHLTNFAPYVREGRKSTREKKSDTGWYNVRIKQDDQQISKEQPTAIKPQSDNQARAEKLLNEWVALSESQPFSQTNFVAGLVSRLNTTQKKAEELLEKLIKDKKIKLVDGDLTR